MKTLLLLLILASTPIMAQPCWQKTVSAMKAVSNTPNPHLAKYMCVWFSDPATLERALVIGKLESDYRNIISSSGKDFGVFQFSAGTVNNYKLDARYLMKNLFYQFDTFEMLMSIKLKECEHKPVPEACWYSKTPELYDRYMKSYLKARDKIRKAFK